ncbi:MAG: VWA domain-containing protein [bacterium]
MKKLVVMMVLVLAASGCASNDAESFGASDNSAPRDGNTGVGQSGAQDFGRFRAIVESGELPSPDTLDVVGFFNEHKDRAASPDVRRPGLPSRGARRPREHDQWVKLHGGPRGMNTALDPSDYERPPLNLAIVVDISGSMQGESIDAVKLGLQDFASKLDPKDDVTLVAYSTNAKVVVHSTPMDIDRAEFIDAVKSLQAAGGTNIYAGLRQGLDIVLAAKDNNRQNRVILLSDGIATEGITDNAKIINLGETYARQDIGITTIGVGKDFDLNLMRSLSSTGAGNFYFLEDPGAVREVFIEEASSFLVPLANDVRLSFDVEGPYAVRGVYGTRIWDAQDNAGQAIIPSVFMASRQSTQDVTPDGGRRGGGGGILFELVPIPVAEVLDSTPANHKAGTLRLDYALPGTDQRVEQTVQILNPLKPAVAPEAGEFENAAVEKAFVTLNAYVGFKLATERAAVGSPGAALNVLEPLIEQLDGWLRTNDDADIRADLELMRKLVVVVKERSGPQETLGTPPNPWPYD